MTYQIAIPSVGRADRIGDMTLRVLAAGGIDMSRVDVWVPDPASAEEYAPVVASYGAQLQGGSHGYGMARARNAIARGYPVGTDLLQLDDDLRGVYRAVDRTTVVDVEDLDGLIRFGFEQADGALWCVYPVPNPFFMRPDRVRTSGIWYAVGAWFGYRLSGDPCELVHTDDKEDYERSCAFYDRDGRVVRLDGFTYRTKYYKEAGGMQFARTDETIRAGAEYVAGRYPHLATAYTAKSGNRELRLREPKRAPGERY